MKKLMTIGITQPRAATGQDQNAKFYLHLMKGVHGKDNVELENDEDAKDMASWPLMAKEIGVVEVVRPALMWGAPGEIEADIKKAAYKGLEQAGIICRNEWGNYFA